MATTKLMPTTSHGIWQNDNPIHFSLSLLIIQMVLVLVVTRVLGYLLKPLRQPRVIAEIIGGILLGPSALGRNKEYMEKIFPAQSISILSTLANMGLMFFLFMVGLELDLASLRRTGKQAMMISVAGISLPFAAGVGVAFVLHSTINPEAKFLPFLVFMGVALSITAFPVLARILAERKLLTTDVGKMAISAAAANDVVAWIFLALAVALSGSDTSPAVAAWILLCGIAFVIVMFVAVKPFMAWIAHRSPEGQPVDEIYVCITLGGVLISGFVTDFIGIHGIFGAFVFGLIIPKDGPFARVLIEKIEDFVSILLLPLYFAASGLQTNVGTISGVRSFGLLILVIVTACGGKIIGTLAVSMAYGENFNKALTLGFLMNTKGLVELIVLNIGRERKVLNDEMFAIMVIMALVTTFMTTPIVMALYKPARDQVPYKRRQLDVGGGGGEELRILACVHGVKNVPSMINLVEATRGRNKKESGLRLYMLHLLELSERPSSIMMVHRVRRDGLPFSRGNHNNRTQVDGLSVAFGCSYAHLNRVNIRTMTSISSLTDMHTDICAMASSKRAAMIILPFHKYPDDNGVLEMTNPGFQGVNVKTLQHAPCSVGILVDRGSLGAGRDHCREELNPSSRSVNQRVAVVFFGGPDDREALAFGLRMAEHPGIKLTVVRFSPTVAAAADEHIVTVSLTLTPTPKPAPTSASNEEMRVEEGKGNGYDIVAGDGKDELVVEEAKKRGDVEVKCVEEEDVIEGVLRYAKKNENDLLIVGRGRGRKVGIGVWKRQVSYAELGHVGDALASSSSFDVKSSVLVIQQFDPQLLLTGDSSSSCNVSVTSSSSPPLL